MFSRVVETLLKKWNNVILELICTLEENFEDVFTVFCNQVYEELKIEEMDKKLDREVKDQEDLDEELE
jgi:hypothetical protein